MAAGTIVEAQEPPHSAELDRAIIEQAKRHGVPERLVRRIVMRESKYNARARNHAYWGLMQISYPTAKSMGFKGSPEELLNPFVNLTYAVPYLANAFIIAGKQEDQAVRLYASGYYYTARQRGVLGALRTAASAPLDGATYAANIVTDPAYRAYGALVGNGEPQQPAPQPMQTASAAPEPAPRPVFASAGGPAGDQGGGVDMLVGKKGNLSPPKKWLHDGGMTQIARGEQGIEKVAAYDHADGKDATSRKSARRSRKNTEFASLDTPASAQAYAAAAPQDPRLAQAASQAAIAQATSPQPATYAQAASQPLPGQQPAPQTAAYNEPAAAQSLEPGQPESNGIEVEKKSKSKRAHRKRGHDDGTTEVAKSDGGSADADATPKKHTRHAKTSATKDVAAATDSASK